MEIKLMNGMPAYGATGGATQTEGTQAAESVQTQTVGNDKSALFVDEARNRVNFALNAGPDIADAVNFTPEERAEYLAAVQEKFTSARMSLGNKSVMFDIYAVLELLRETSQELRNSMREVRLLENQAIQQSIRDQAAKQRSAAWCQMIGGAVVGLMQGVATIGGLAKQISSINKQITANQQMGVGMADKQMKMAQVGGNEALAQKQLTKVESQIPADVQKEVNAKFTTIEEQPKVMDAQKKVDAGKAAIGEIDGKIAKVKEEIGGLQADRAHKAHQLGTGELAPGEPLTESEAAKLQSECSQIIDQIGAKQTELAELQGQKTKLEQELVPLENDLAKAKADPDVQKVVHEKALEVVETCKSEYEQALNTANNEKRVTGAVSSQTQQRLEAAGQKYEYARAKQVAMSSSMEHISPAEHQKVAMSATDDMAAKSKAAAADSKTPESEKGMAYGMMLQQFSTIFGQMGQQVVSGISQIIQSQGTELQAEQKQHEEQLDQIKDLFTQDLQLIQKANELMQSVVAKESQSIDEIINALRA